MFVNVLLERTTEMTERIMILSCILAFVISCIVGALAGKILITQIRKVP